MGKHNDKEFHDKLQASFRQGLEKQFRNGLAQGLYAGCKVIADKAVNEEMSPEERLSDILAFCKQITDKQTPDNNTSEKTE